ncbi:EamA family transporter [Clostridium aestuarii]|uniref:EamA family transporter n=1 Tax=Clostridium aestuarii TaxID=338193 RepID=A0ABT4CWN0_9CLOT|nr:EamA family transporter [Clostridium aestuarii]MCY6483416.1 EamA family transporter [Clostridium aestuarii]
MKKIHGVFYAMMSSAAFGLTPIWTKDAYNRGTNSITILFFRGLVAAAILLMYFLIKRINFKINKKQLVHMLFLGTIGYGCTGICLFLSYSYISTGLATTLHFIYPAAVTILMVLIYKEKIYFGKIFSIILSAAGVYCLICTSNIQLNIKGVVLAIISGVFYSLYIIGIDKGEGREMDSLILTFYVTLVSAVFMFIFAKFTVGIKVVFTYHTVIDIIGVAVISSILALVTFAKGIKIIGSSSASILSTLEPIVSVLLGILILKEKMSLSIIIGIMLIIFSVFVLTITEKSKEKIKLSI